MSKYWVFSCPYLPVFGIEYGEILPISLRILSECEKIRTRKNSVFGHFLRSECEPYYQIPGKHVRSALIRSIKFKVRLQISLLIISQFQWINLHSHLNHLSRRAEVDEFDPLSANPTKWSNTFKQFHGNLPTNCLSVFEHFVILTLKGLILEAKRGDDPLFGVFLVVSF